MDELARDLLAFIDSAPTPYHAVAECARRLEDHGFEAFDEAEPWVLEPGKRFYVVRNQGSLAAVVTGQSAPAASGFRVLGAHTDSPNLRVKPRPDFFESGYRQISFEPYGGVLLYTWLDRELSLAGRVSVVRDGSARTVLVDLKKPLLRIPSLAIHLQREIREEGLKLNPQLHMAPVLGVGPGATLLELLATHLEQSTGEQTRPDDIAAFDLMAYDTAAAELGGAAGELICAPRIDNLASCHGALTALLRTSAQPAAASRVVVLYDHEEVGSRSDHGAESSFLRDVLERVSAERSSRADESRRALARSMAVSVDMAHAVHPNWTDRSERGHRPVIGGGPVIKSNVNQAYASDARSAAAFVALCRRCEVPFQSFVSRSDLACGTTIGPILAARTGISTVDVGNPMFAMHSCRETAGAADVEPMVRVLGAFLEH